MERRQATVSEHELAEGIGRGDADAMSDLYELYGSTTFGFLVTTLGDRSAAEDVQQQVFLDVWRSADTYDSSRSGLLTWIMAIARNRAIDYKRRRTPVPSGDRLAETESDNGLDSPDVLAERWRVAGLMERLHPQEREVLRLRFYEDLTQREIAMRMSMPLGTVKMRMVDGLRRLREVMGEFE